MAGVFCFASGSKHNNSQLAPSTVDFIQQAAPMGVDPVATSIHSKFKSEVAHGENK